MLARILGVVGVSLGLGMSTVHAAEDTITLGAAVSLTGKYSINGQYTRDGYDLAVERINERGGVEVAGKRYELAINYYDDESTPARATQLAERLINQDGVKFLLGPYSSGLTKAMAPVTERHKVPMVEANGASRTLFSQAYEYLFAVRSSSKRYLRSAIALLAEQAEANGRAPSALEIAGAFGNDPFAQGIRLGVRADAARHGMRMVIDDQLPPNLDDMAATLTKVKAMQPDLLAVSGHAKGAILTIRQLSEMKAHVPMLAMTHCDSAGIIEKFGADAEYTLCAAQWDRSLAYEGERFGTAEAFAQAVEAEYGYAPPSRVAESAAAVLVYADAFERADSLAPKDVREALAATELETFYGRVRFDEAGKNVAEPTVLYQVQDGEYVVVAPSDRAVAEPRYPVPSWSER